MGLLYLYIGSKILKIKIILTWTKDKKKYNEEGEGRRGGK